MPESIQLDRKVVAKKFVVGDSVRAAAEVHGRAYPDLVIEIARCMFGAGKIQPDEYFQMQLFDADHVAREQLPSFTGRRVEFIHNRTANDIVWWRDLCEDKLAFHALMTGLGFPVPELVAVFHPSRSMGPGFEALQTADAVAGLLRDAGRLPLFVKPNGLSWSLGAASLASTDGSTVTDLFGRTSTVEDLAAQIASMGAEGGFVFQRTSSNHPELVAVCGKALATVRMLVVRDEDGPRVARTHVKLPAGDNVADNTWRAGNLAVEVDPETGRLGQGWRGEGLDAKSVDEHPDTGAALDRTLPDWSEACALVVEATRALDGLRIVGWDVALTPDGPLLVEANSDPDWKVNQRITGRGMLDERFAAFLDRCKRSPQVKSS